MLPWRDAAIKMGYQASIAIPIADDAGVMGALMVYAAEANSFDADELALLEELGKALAFGIMGIRERKKRYEALISAVGAIAATVELRDPYTAGHQRHVADIAVAIASEMQLSADQVEGIRLAAIIHDVGKIGVPVEILSKPTKLSPLEFSLIQTHAESGYDLLKAIPFEWPIAEMVRQHHERMDGSGYPRGLKGDAIDLGARIIAVADVVDSMSSHRPYRAALGIDKALEELAKGQGTIYDTKVVDVCAQLFRDKRLNLEHHSL
jgi:HD-GYP domain-containing protein (c-di-GMP phosphodiesterase class II)